MRTPWLVSLTLALLAGTAVTGISSAGRPSTDFGTYVLFATEHIRIRGLTIGAGNVGVDNGELEVRRDLDAARSQVAATSITFPPPAGNCSIAQLFANNGADGSSPCGAGTPYTAPILGTLDLAHACQFPPPTTACSPTAAIVNVSPGETRTLSPNTYGNVVVTGSGNAITTLVFQGGDYTLCSLRASRDTRLLFAGPSTVRVSGDLRIGDRSFTGPGSGSNIAARDIRFFSSGQRVSIRQLAQTHALFCAPAARAHVGARVSLEGQLAAREIRLDRDVVASLSGTSAGTTTTVTVTTSTSSTSTTAPRCGDGIRESGEVCDPPDFGNATCPGSSVVGAFLHCVDSCARIDFNDCPGPSSTSTSTTTITATSTSTSTTTPARCGDGVVNGTEVCDPPDFGTATCPGSSVVGQNLGCSADCQQIDTSQCGPVAAEVCGNCLDDDGNGLTDFEDPACCTQLRTFHMTLNRARIVAGAGSSRLRLRSILARAGLARVDPTVQDVFLQLKPQQGTDVLCVRIPAASFVAKGRTFRFVDKQATVTSARGITATMVRIRPDGSVRFKARGKQVLLGDARQGPVQVTVGFHSPDGVTNNNRCSTTTQSFRSTKGGLKAP